MKNKDRRTHRKPSSEAAAQGSAPMLRWNPAAGGLPGVPFQSPIANVLTVSSPLRPSRAA